MEVTPRHECPDCSFVQDKKTLFVFLVPRDLKEKANNKPQFFGKFTMTGWNGHSGFYLFKCKSCDQVSIDYPHGYMDFGLMYLSCDNCEENLPLEVSQHRDIYESEGVCIPNPKREDRVQDFNKTVADIESKGIRVIIPNQGVSVGGNLRNNVWSMGLILLGILTLGILFFRILS